MWATGPVAELADMGRWERVPEVTDIGGQEWASTHLSELAAQASLQGVWLEDDERSLAELALVRARRGGRNQRAEASGSAPPWQHPDDLALQL